LRSAASGAGFGAGVSLASALLLAAVGAVDFAATPSPSLMLPRVASWAAIVMVVGLLQELAFRGWLLGWLRTRLAFWPAAVVASLAFAAIHLERPGETPMGLAGLAVLGLAAAAGLRRTGTLAWPMSFHAAWNVSQDAVLGLPDGGAAPHASLLVSRGHGSPWLTGGTAGLEGAATTLVLMAALTAALSRLPGDRRHGGDDHTAPRQAT
jgi:membrane protease YdiL (CAAX protease family)